MKSISYRWLLTCSAVVALAHTACQTNRVKDDDPKGGEAENPLDRANQILAGAKPLEGTASAREKCLAKHTAALELCGKREDREVCEATARAFISVCEEIGPEVTVAQAGTLFCSGICAVRQCNPTCPLPGGGGVCLGNVCVNPGQVCDPGTFWDCHCETNVVGPPVTQSNFCDCACQ